MLSRVLAGEVQQVRTGEGRGGGRGVCGAGVCCLHDTLTDMLLLLLLLLLLLVVAVVVVVSLLLLSNWPNTNDNTSRGHKAGSNNDVTARAL